MKSESTAQPLNTTFTQPGFTQTQSTEGRTAGMPINISPHWIAYWKENGGSFLTRQPCIPSASMKTSHSSECKTESKEDNKQDL